ncbi:uncharacterized protein Z519_12322 [Cladophialophora bantiana CBS 173.52]|uniref:DASH complex subunit DAD2 n=1 Tax=Cladophialophora bantiana (strain ATCC 10958 / CBS 173.52 / CDC B-1940 / NIH 8579) TaxID=1442370 RepID=A0A0D2H860_CLAB1|nr:uncharacterized protein Z519_12322 [Cladophialophora bantiana CBS 173.52]KIW87025.1 hypothetical protein Z519_12322 [Cladophialophora bantiana CBS 173.52]
MSYAPRPTDIHPSASAGSNTSSTLRSSTLPAQSHLQARIASKRAELENLRQLCDLSAHLTSQLEQLEKKLGSLRDGAQAVALVLANWENVLQVIGMAAMKVPKPPPAPDVETVPDRDVEGKMAGKSKQTQGHDQELPEQELPVPLVRIPVQPKAEDGG